MASTTAGVEGVCEGGEGVDVVTGVLGEERREGEGSITDSLSVPSDFEISATEVEHLLGHQGTDRVYTHTHTHHHLSPIATRVNSNTHTLPPHVLLKGLIRS